MPRPSPNQKYSADTPESAEALLTFLESVAQRPSEVLEGLREALSGVDALGPEIDGLRDLQELARITNALHLTEVSTLQGALSCFEAFYQCRARIHAFEMYADAASQTDFIPTNLKTQLITQGYYVRDLPRFPKWTHASDIESAYRGLTAQYEEALSTIKRIADAQLMKSWVAFREVATAAEQCFHVFQSLDDSGVLLHSRRGLIQELSHNYQAIMDDVADLNRRVNMAASYQELTAEIRAWLQTAQQMIADIRSDGPMKKRYFRYAVKSIIEQLPGLESAKLLDAGKTETLRGAASNVQKIIDQI